MKKTVILIVAAVSVFAMFVVCRAEEYDLRTVSGITAEELEPYMHKDVKFLASDVVRICNENGISAEFVATLMRWERRMDINNFFGWTKNDGKLMRFSTPEECLEKIIPLIKKNYLSDDGKYFHGYTVEAVSRCYNNSDFWREKIENGTMRIVNSERERKSEETEEIPEVITVSETLSEEESPQVLRESSARVKREYARWQRVVRTAAEKEEARPARR